MLFIIASILGIAGKYFFVPFFKLILSPFRSYGRIASRLLTYITGNYSDGSFTKLGVFLSLTKRMLFIPVILILRKKLNAANQYLIGLINLYFIGNIIYILFGFNEAISPLTRMTTPFLFTEVFILPAILSILKQSYWKYLFLCFLFIYGLLKLNSALNAYPDLFIPYRSIF
jgi:hypothetical protein